MQTPWMRLAIGLLSLLLIAACAADDDDDEEILPDDEVEQTGPALGASVFVVPSDGLPAELFINQANNNLDVERHEDRVFLAFRTAPNHFASDQAMIHVVNSDDQETWDYEATFAPGTDVREPRLLSFDGGLFLYFAVLGDNPLNFEPGEMRVSEYVGPGQWTDPEPDYVEGFIPWRTKVVDGTAMMIGYVGGDSIYSLNPDPIQVHWVRTADGRNWEPVVPGQPVVLVSGGSETDIVILDDGSLVAVSRNELGDESGYGMKICRAGAETLGAWECVTDPKKYDSPLLFERDGEVYLIGRRNLSGSGNYDLMQDQLAPLFQRLVNELVYWLFPKRCSLWEVDPETLTVDYVLDLPSKGDTCFPGLIDDGDDGYWIYNYTSPLEGDDVAWLDGQLGPTYILRTELMFLESDEPEM